VAPRRAAAWLKRQLDFPKGPSQQEGSAAASRPVSIGPNEKTPASSRALFCRRHAPYLLVRLLGRGNSRARL